MYDCHHTVPELFNMNVRTYSRNFFMSRGSIKNDSNNYRSITLIYNKSHHNLGPRLGHYHIQQLTTHHCKPCLICLLKNVLQYLLECIPYPHPRPDAEWRGWLGWWWTIVFLLQLSLPLLYPDLYKCVHMGEWNWVIQSGIESWVKGDTKWV